MKKDYLIKELSQEEFQPLFDRHKSSAFEDVHSYPLQDLLSDAERQNIANLGQNLGSPFRLYLGVFDAHKQFVGWTWGIQENSSTFYMVNSAILKEHRRQGLYRNLIEKCVAIVSEKGFQLIYSRHCATNNDVIIPKLKAGFIISKMEIDDKFGVLIHLHFYTNLDRRKIMDYRSGQRKPDKKIKQIFKL